MNNPVSFVDVNGRVVQALDNQSQKDILNSLPKDMRCQVSFSDNGTIDKELINSISSTDENFKCLQDLVNSDVVFKVENRADIIVKDMDGDGNNESYPMEEGFKGFTATPTSTDGKYLSIYPNGVHVQINKNSDSKTRAKYIGHELYGHAYFFLKGKKFEHEYIDGTD